MNIKLGNSELCLRPGQPLGLRGAAGLGIRCIAGTVWITSPGEPTDIFLEAGGFHRIRGPGLTLVESLGDGRIGLEWPERCLVRNTVKMTQGITGKMPRLTIFRDA